MSGLPRIVFLTGEGDIDIFSGTTMEDAIVIKRHISVVENCVPSVSSIAVNGRWKSSRPGAGRRYFTDYNVRTDQMPNGTVNSA